MVKPATASDLNVRLVINGLVGKAGTSAVWNAASVAAQNLQAQERVKKLWADRDSLDQQALVDLALALERIGRRQDAVDVLTDHAQATDGMGTLAGRLKRRWLDGRRQADADRALELYEGALKMSEDGHDWPQAYYHAINVAFMQFAYKQNRTASELNARKALDYCARVAPSMWSRATCAEAHLYLGNYDNAIEAYREAITPKPGTWVAPDTWQVTSMYDQAMEVAQRLGQEGIARRLTALFRDPAQPSDELGQRVVAHGQRA
jgi:tetratricopeptide (TPR) repeat protein